MDFVVQIVDLCTKYLYSFGPALGFIIIILESFIPPLPLGIFVALNCKAYGLIIGLILSWIATIIGCILSYYLFKQLTKKVIYKYISKKKKDKINRASFAFTKISFSNLVLLISLPFTPAFLINIIAGVTQISEKKYISALIIGKISTILFWGIVGKSLLDSIKDIKVIFIILVLLLITYTISKIVNKKMHIE